MVDAMVIPSAFAIGRILGWFKPRAGKRLGLGQKCAGAVADRPECLLARNGLDDFVVIPGVTRLLWLLYLDQIHVVHHPSVNTQSTVIGEEIMDRHVAHLGDDGLRLIAAERVNRLEVMRHRRIDPCLRLGRHHAAAGEEPL